jgi:hypothetical protein
MLRVTLLEQDILELMDRFPKLSRTEISDVITRDGPMRGTVESELERLSNGKR